MFLSEFIAAFEDGIQVASLLERAGDEESRRFLLSDSETLYSGDLRREVRNVAFLVQPNEALCVEAMESGFDTIMSHHRWCRKKDGSPMLGELDGTLKAGGVNMLSYHLCWDICRKGLADLIMSEAFKLNEWEESPLTYRGYRIPALMRWVKKSFTFRKVNEILTDSFIRTERFLGRLDCDFDRLVVIPGGGLSDPILESIVEFMPFDEHERILVLSSGSGMDTKEHYLDFFTRHEKNFSILDANHYDLEAVGVAWWARHLDGRLAPVRSTMLFADHYVSFSI